MPTSTQVSAQYNKVAEGRKGKTKRNRPRLNITVSKEVHEWLHEKVPNISEFIDNLVRAVMHKIEPHVVLISPIGETSGRARGSAWLERAPDKRKVRGSNPRGPIFLIFVQFSICESLKGPWRLSKSNIKIPAEQDALPSTSQNFNLKLQKAPYNLKVSVQS